MKFCGKGESGRAVLTAWGLIALTIVLLLFAGILHEHWPQTSSWELETLIDLVFGCGVGFIFCPALLTQLEWKLELKSLWVPLAVGTLLQLLVISVITQSRNDRGMWLGLVVVILAPIAEETLARGMVLRSLTASKPEDWIIWVLLVSSFMALMHRWFWLSILAQGLISIAYLKPKPSLGRAIIVHMTMNTVTFLARTL